MPLNVSEMLQVYPRVCGGSLWRVWAAPSDGGLSPRVRGKQERGRAGGVKLRSIPACAGEAAAPPAAVGVVTVYPRVCGGSQLVKRACR